MYNLKNENYSKFLAQNIENENVDTVGEVSDSDNGNSIEVQDSVDNLILNSRNDKTFSQCSAAGNIYSEEELNDGLQELNG